MAPRTKKVLARGRRDGGTGDSWPAFRNLLVTPIVADFDRFSWKINEKSWVFTISKMFFGNLGVDHIHHLKLCAGLACASGSPRHGQRRRAPRCGGSPAGCRAAAASAAASTASCSRAASTHRTPAETGTGDSRIDQESQSSHIIEYVTRFLVCFRVVYVFEQPDTL